MKFRRLDFCQAQRNPGHLMFNAAAWLGGIDTYHTMGTYDIDCYHTPEGQRLHWLYDMEGIDFDTFAINMIGPLGEIYYPTVDGVSFILVYLDDQGIEQESWFNLETYPVATYWFPGGGVPPEQYGLIVRVKDADTGSSIAGATVHVDGGIGTTWDGGAGFTLLAGIYKLWASAPGYSDSEPVEIEITENTEVEIILTPTGVVPPPTPSIMEVLMPLLVLWVIGGIIFVLFGGAK